MNFPLSTADIELWLAAIAIILLITSEMLFSLPQYSARTMLDKRLFRIVATGSGIGFLITVVMRIFQV